MNACTLFYRSIMWRTFGIYDTPDVDSLPHLRLSPRTGKSTFHSAESLLSNSTD